MLRLFHGGRFSVHVDFIAWNISLRVLQSLNPVLPGESETVCTIEVCDRLSSVNHINRTARVKMWVNMIEISL